MQKTKGSVVLGGLNDKSTHFKEGSSRHVHFNNGGVIESHKTYYSITQTPDGKCVKTIVEERNGVATERRVDIDCDKVKQYFHDQEEESHKELMKQEQEFFEEEEKMIQDINLKRK